MALFCEPCREKKKWIRPRAFPYHTHKMGTCEVCKKHKDCFDYPLIVVKPDVDKTVEDRMLFDQIQREYQEQAENLIIAFVSGPRAGAIDYGTTAEMKKAIVRTETNEVDWYATYELRRKIQDGYLKVRR